MAISEANKSKKWGLVIDVTRCDGCGSCLLSVKDEYTYNEYPGYCGNQPVDGYTWLTLKEFEQGHGTKLKMDYVPVMWPHNRNLNTDIPGVPEGAIYVREDGLTIIDPEKAKGCRALYDYFAKIYNGYQYPAVKEYDSKNKQINNPDVIFWNEEQQLPQIYILDAHRLDEGERIVRCAEDCPTQAMHWGDLNDPESDVSKFVAAHPDEIEDYFQEEGADYVVRYYKLPKPFLAGEVMVSDSADCVKGAKVTLTPSCKHGTVRQTETDFFGDFEFKGLRLNGTYTVRAEVPGYQPKEVTVTVDEAKNLGVITLDKA